MKIWPFTTISKLQNDVAARDKEIDHLRNRYEYFQISLVNEQKKVLELFHRIDVLEKRAPNPN